MKRKFGEYQGELKIFVTLDGKGNEDYTFNRLTPEQKGLAEDYLRKLNESSRVMSEITQDLKGSIFKSLKDKEHSDVEIKVMGCIENKKEGVVIIYKNPLK